MTLSLVWFRNDLRVTDHPALAAAVARGPVVACYTVTAGQWREHDMSDWRLAFQLRSLQVLADSLADLNVPLKLIDTPSFSDVTKPLVKLCQQLDITDVDFIDEYPLNEVRRDERIETALMAEGVRVHRHVGDVLVAPSALSTQAGQPYTVFTPFFKRWRGLTESALDHYCESPTPQRPLEIASDVIPAQIDGVAADHGAQLWPAGETTALEQLQGFLAAAVERYDEDRDLPAVLGTSRLSPHLAVGTVSPRQCLRAALHQPQTEGRERWISEIAWRDFYRHIVSHFPHVSWGHAFRQEMDALPWRHAPDELAAWQAGNTGYPLVDAAMRQLNATGWMHNRLRMVAAMFLTKHLLIDWREGERYFMRNLVDGDFASNNGGWQWSASTGTDAAPYFRIFNPASQGQRFDAAGEFLLQYVPELQGLSRQELYNPPPLFAGDYPQPIVEHRLARERALAFFKA